MNNIEALLLPEYLQELHSATLDIARRAEQYPGDVNASSATLPEKIIAITRIRDELDARASEVFLEKQVEVSGSYTYPFVTSDKNNDPTLKSVTELGVRRGKSYGFERGVDYMVDENGETDPNNATVSLSYIVGLGTLSLTGRNYQLSGPAILNGPVDCNRLALTEIVDYGKRLDAIQALSVNRRGSRILQRLDKIVDAGEGADLRQLGTRLTRIHVAEPQYTDYCLDYLNAVFLRANTELTLLCDYAVDITAGNKPIIITPHTISGNFQGIVFTNAYRVDRRNHKYEILSLKRPAAVLVASTEQNKEPHIVTVPLQAVQGHSIAA